MSARIVHADVAQLVAQLICNQWVAGSIPVIGTRLSAGQTVVFRLTFLFADLKVEACYSP